MEAGSHFSKAKAVLDKLVPTLSGLQKTKIIVDGYTDNVPIGPGLKREGISSNLELSSRRADGVVEYLVQQQSRFFLRQTPFCQPPYTSSNLIFRVSRNHSSPFYLNTSSVEYENRQV